MSDGVYSARNDAEEADVYPTIAVCPKCNGRGTVLINDGFGTSICPTCRGTKKQKPTLRMSDLFPTNRHGLMETPAERVMPLPPGLHNFGQALPGTETITGWDQAKGPDRAVVFEHMPRPMDLMMAASIDYCENCKGKGFFGESPIEGVVCLACDGKGGKVKQ